MTQTLQELSYANWLSTWLSRQQRFIKESTYSIYQVIAQNHLIPQLGDKDIHALDNEFIQSFLLEKFDNGRLDHNGGLSRSSVQGIAKLLKASLITAMHDGIIPERNINYQIPKDQYDKIVKSFSKHEQKQIVKHALDNFSSRSLGILISLNTGLRIGEVCALQWSDIDLSERVIHITKTIQRIYQKSNGTSYSKVIITRPKSNSSNRVVPISHQLTELMRKLKSQPSDYVLSGNEKYIEPRTFRVFYKEFLDDININHRPFHSLRHSFATQCIELGVDYKTISEILGHASASITLNLYVHPQIELKHKCVELLSDFLNP